MSSICLVKEMEHVFTNSTRIPPQEQSTYCQRFSWPRWRLLYLRSFCWLFFPPELPGKANVCGQNFIIRIWTISCFCLGKKLNRKAEICALDWYSRLIIISYLIQQRFRWWIVILEWLLLETNMETEVYFHVLECVLFENWFLCKECCWMS